MEITNQIIENHGLSASEFENIKKLLGPTDVLKDKKFLTIIIIMILYLMYM